MPPSPATTALLDIEAVAERLGVQVRHVRRLVAERRIPYLKWGHLLRFDPRELDQVDRRCPRRGGGYLWPIALLSSRHQSSPPEELS